MTAWKLAPALFGLLGAIAVTIVGVQLDFSDPTVSRLPVLLAPFWITAFLLGAVSAVLHFRSASRTGRTRKALGLLLLVPASLAAALALVTFVNMLVWSADQRLQDPGYSSYPLTVANLVDVVFGIALFVLVAALVLRMEGSKLFTALTVVVGLAVVFGALAVSAALLIPLEAIVEVNADAAPEDRIDLTSLTSSVRAQVFAHWSFAVGTVAGFLAAMRSSTAS